jgi:hypothetical protein
MRGVPCMRAPCPTPSLRHKHMQKQP